MARMSLRASLSVNGVSTHLRQTASPAIVATIKLTRQTTTAKMPKKTSAKVSDPDDSAWTEDMRGASVLKRGWGPQAAPAKVLKSVRMDADILAKFKAQRVGYPSRINAALCMGMAKNLTSGHQHAPRKCIANVRSILERLTRVDSCPLPGRRQVY